MTMAIKKVFVSQPMNGISDQDIEKVRRETIELVKPNLKDTLGTDVFRIIDSTLALDIPSTVKYNQIGIYYLGESLKLLATADIAVFGKGWDEARGCKIEHAVCEAYGIPHIDL